MHEPAERELTLAAPPPFALAALAPGLERFVLGPPAIATTEAQAYDTSDLRLTRWGCSLRFHEPDEWTLQLLQPGRAGGLVRSEHIFRGLGATVPAAALDLATAYLRGRVPQAVAALRLVRVRRSVHDAAGRRVGMLAEDAAGTAGSEPLRQLDITLAAGVDGGVLDELAAALQAAGAGPEHAAGPAIAAPQPSRAASAGDLFRATFANSVQRLLRTDAALRLGGDDEAVHEARVAMRRMRSDLRTFRPLLAPAWADDLRERMRRASAALAATRDADVLAERVRRQLETLPAADRAHAGPLLATLAAARSGADAALARTLRDPGYVALLEEVVAAAEAPAFLPRAAAPARAVAGELLDDAWAALRRAVRRRSRPPADADLHRIRIKTKRVRYAAEALAPVAGGRLRALARSLADLQAVLGDQHDAATSAAALRAIAATDGAAFVAGEIAAREDAAAAACRDRWRAAWLSVKERRRRVRQG